MLSLIRTTFQDASSDKKWNNPINWSTGTVPGTTAKTIKKETALVISGQTAYLDSDLPPEVQQAYNVTVGNGPPGGTVIASRDNPHLHNVKVATSNGAVGAWEQNAGTSSLVNLAVGGSAGGGGTVKLRGGGMNLTDGIAINDSGSLVAHGENDVEVRADGDMTLTGAALLHLYVGGTGATLVTLGGDLHVDSAESRLIVDCGFYGGGNATIDVVKYKSISGSFSPDKVELVGLGAYGGSLSAGDDSLELRITLNPTTTNQFATSSGDWGTADNWSQGSVPNGTSSANVNHNRTAIVHDGTRDIVEIVEVGNDHAPNTQLRIEADFLADKLLIASAGVGNVVQLNGSVTINRQLEIAASTKPPPAEGNGSSSSNNNGGYTISGGSLHFPYATLTVGTAGSATFQVEGCLSDEISGHGLRVGSGGSLRFVLDRAGVTPIKLDGVFEFDAGGVVTVDGTNYNGSSGYFPLIRGGTLLGGSLDPSTISFVGFDDREPEIVMDDGGLWVRLNEAPLSHNYGGDLTGLFPASRVSAVKANNTLSISTTYSPSESLWGAVFSQAHVMDMLMSNENKGGNESEPLSWNIRIGRGGQIYSFRAGSIGEVVPPNNYAGSPWIDSVWQGGGATSDPTYPDFGIHQCGMYLQDEVRTDPYYSPMVAAKINPGTGVCMVNWATIPKSVLFTDDNPDNDWKSTFLCYNRYQDMGDGVIEVTLGLYNYGPISLNHINLPWGGVRRTSMDYAFMSRKDGSWYGTDGYENLFVKNRDTGGWIAYSDSTSGDAPSLGVVFGYGSTPFEPGSENQPAYVRSNYYSNGKVPVPDATAWRNGHVFTNIRKFVLGQGRGVWCRYYFVLGSDVSDVQERIADRNLVATATLDAFDYTEANTTLLGYRVQADKNANQILEDSTSPDFYLYAYPVNGSFPVYEVTEKHRAPYLSFSPYANGAIKQYDGTIAGVRLLGFALRTSDADATTYNYGSLSDVLAGYAHYYKAAGETLSVRLPGMYVLTDPNKVDMLLVEPDPVANGSIGLNYSAATPSANIDITVTISAESHPGSFNLLSPATQTLTPPYPGSTALDFQFDNTVANITSGEISTCLVTIAWTEQGSGATEETLVPMSVTLSFPPGQDNELKVDGGNWGDASSWSLGRVPGVSGADDAFVGTNATLNYTVQVASDFRGSLPWNTVVGQGGTLIIAADFLGGGNLYVPFSKGIGCVNQTAGRVTTPFLRLGDTAGTAATNSVYNLSGGELLVDDGYVTPKGLMDINGGTLNINAAVSSLDTLKFGVGKPGGLIKLRLGTLTKTGPESKNIRYYMDIHVSGGAVSHNGAIFMDNAEFRMIGDGSSVSISKYNVGQYASIPGTTFFEVGANGISTIYAPSEARLEYSKIVVDGSAYRGGSATFKLIDTKSLASVSSDVTVANFPEGMTAEINQDQDNNQVTLTINSRTSTTYSSD